MPTKILKKLSLALLIAAVALEVVLQAGAMLVAAIYAPPEVGAASGSGVLCIGDSFTFGVGATSRERSYPGRLRHLLQDQGIDVAVHNAGFPGQTSRDLLSRLPQQLDASTRLLCVLVGTNDSWKHPEPLAGGSHDVEPLRHGTFQWRWRTPDVIRLIRDFEWSSWKRNTPASQGAAQLTSSGESDAPIIAPRDLIAAGFEMMTAQGLPVGKTEKLISPDPASPGGSQISRGWQLMSSGDYQAALEFTQQLEETHPDSPTVLGLVVAAATRCGLADAAEAAFDRIKALRRERPSNASSDVYVATLYRTGQHEVAIAEATQRIDEQPRSLPAWEALQGSLFTLGRFEEAKAAMPSTLDLIGRNSPKWTAHILRNYVLTICAEEPRRAATLAVAAHLLDSDRAHSRRLVRALAGKCDPDALTEVVESCDPGIRAGLVDLIDLLQGKDSSDSWVGVMQQHLLAIHQLAAKQGTQMVLLTYPFNHVAVEQAQEDAANILGIPLVRIRPRFDRELKDVDRDVLFVADGHCSDRGYAIMAEEVAKVVAPLLR